MGVASAEHAGFGAERGWIQLNHGKRNNLARMHRGDGFVYYSPHERFGEKTPLRAVTQVGVLTDDEPYLADEVQDMGPKGTVKPWRRNVDFAISPRVVPIHELRLELTTSPNWGYSLRYGLVELTSIDFEAIRDAMTR